MKDLSREELVGLGMDDKQINALLLMSNAGNDTVSEPDPKPIMVVNSGKEMSVTSFDSLQEYARGVLVRFPDFAEGQPFVARVRRPSMLSLAKSGKIPNALLTSANELFAKGGKSLDNDNESMLSDVYSITEIICRAALQEPTYDQIIEAGLELSDDQLTAIFNYVQTGVKSLEPFCEK